MKYIQTINNLFNYYGMLLAATQQRLMDFNGEDRERYKELIQSEAYYQGVIDTLEGFLGLLEEEEIGKTGNAKYI